MPMTEIPPRTSDTPPSPPEGTSLYDADRWESAYRELHITPELVIQLQDDLSRARQREAFWISVIVHILLIIIILNANRLAKYLPLQTVVRLSPSDQAKHNQLTYLELPPDLQRPKERPKTNVISDKDRISAARTPKVETRKFLDSTRPGIQAPPAPHPAEQQAAPQQQAQQPPPPQQQAQQNPVAKLETPTPPAKQPNFNTPNVSAGSAIEQAARAALNNHSTYGGSAGDYGINQGRSAPKAIENMDILTDTMGVDFGPYLQRVLHDVKENWYRVIPESAEPPISKKGKVAIEFVILKNGTVAGMKLDGSSSDIPLDRAAWAGITGSNPFPPLPSEFPGKYLGLRIYFFYNPAPGEMTQTQ
ncbi:MAG TPA: TonB family protein [Terriglobales bacterium]